MATLPGVLLAVLVVVVSAAAPAPQAASLPDDPLQFAGFSALFQSDGVFSLEGGGWPTFKGTWKAGDGEVEIVTSGGPAGCDKAGRYRFQTRDARTTLEVVADE